MHRVLPLSGPDPRLLPRICHLHLGLSVDLEIMQRFLGDDGRVFVGVFDKGDVSARRDESDFEEVGVSERERANEQKQDDQRHEVTVVEAIDWGNLLLKDLLQILFTRSFRQVLQEKNLVGRQVFVRHLKLGAFRRAAGGGGGGRGVVRSASAGGVVCGCKKRWVASNKGRPGTRRGNRRIFIYAERSSRV